MSGRGSLAWAAGILLLGVMAVLWRQAHPPYASVAGGREPVRLVPVLTGEPEYCLTCHQGIEEISPSHPLEVFGCVRCHGGNGLALTKEDAHRGLLGGANPSDFRVVEEACGGEACHSGAASENRDHIARATTSLQATYAGAIAQVRRAFGAQEDARARYAVVPVVDPDGRSATGVLDLLDLQAALGEDPQAVRAFSQTCTTCHLNAPPPDLPAARRLTGCAACHALSNLGGTYVGDDPTLSHDEPGHAAQHRLTLAIPYTQCNTCHNRGNYSLVDMQFHPRQDLPADRRAPRVQDYYQPIAQFTRCEYQLDCIDCHTAQEVMGDGDLYSAQAEMQYVQCKTCHGTLQEPPLTRALTDSADPAFRRAFLNPYGQLEVGDEVVVTERGEVLWNVVRRADGEFILTSKTSGRTYRVPLVMASGCTQDPERQESSACHACHAVERP